MSLSAIHAAPKIPPHATAALPYASNALGLCGLYAIIGVVGAPTEPIRTGALLRFFPIDIPSLGSSVSTARCAAFFNFL
jgi:hypothetical protein